MKKALIILIVAFSSCTIHYSMGMTEADFLKRNKGMGIRLEEQTPSRTVYKSCSSVDCYFFYFSHGTLYSIDKGVSRPDVIIQTR